MGKELEKISQPFVLSTEADECHYITVNELPAALPGSGSGTQ